MNECAFCGDGRVIHHHHIVPRRFGGPDAEGNLLPVCPTCHAIVERTWDDEFYRSIGVYRVVEDKSEQTVLDAVDEIWELSIKDLIGNTHSELWGQTRRDLAYEARNACIASLVSLLDGYRQCDGCSKLTDSNQCHICGMLEEVPDRL